MSTERDEHFQGFAELVAQELKRQGLLWIGTHIRPLTDPPVDFDYEKVKLILARRAYDLVEHVLSDPCIEYSEHIFDPGRPVNLKDIPDLIQWSEQEENL